MDKSMLAEINRLRQMSVGELRVRWRELYGEESRSRNRDYLWKRLAWRVQELAYGALSDRAKQRLEELAPTAEFIRRQIPRGFNPAAVVSAADTRSRRERKVRDIRLPAPGTVISRTWRGRELRLLVLKDGFELDGARYGSLSEAARAATGAHWNGKLFWGLTQRSRRK